ncbi:MULTISPECIES: T6SS immunity protein Tli4 family protein [Burkholderia]|uniref:T6SS immunity protein Tli4 family protein n=1 Tax=Burkholderia TaxID=32008 RepID=UPI001E3E29B2|nr:MULTISPECIES: T6SS immunity protein Tli4 family protein [Burkholderia]
MGKALVFMGLLVSTTLYAIEPAMSKLILANSHPWCIGRLTFDRPALSEVFNQNYEFRGERIQTAYGVSKESFKRKIAVREQELRAAQRVDPGENNKETGHPWLEKSFSPIASARVFVYRDMDLGVTDLDYKTESYLWVNDRLFSMSDKIGPNFVVNAEEYYVNLLQRIEIRDNWQVPTISGFCIDGGIVKGASRYPEEASQSILLLPGRPALLIVKTRESTIEDQGHPLTKNMSDLRAQLNRMPGHYQILRQGKRQVAGMDAEEVLFKLRDGDVTVFRFYLLAPGDPGTLARPHTSIQMHLGAPPRATLPAEQATSPVDEAGALQTWDTLLDSLKLRPGAI